MQRYFCVIRLSRAAAELCSRSCVSPPIASNPAGIASCSPGVASLRATLGCGQPEPSTLQGLRPRGLTTCVVDLFWRYVWKCCNPFRVGADHRHSHTQGSRCATTAGLKALIPFGDHKTTTKKTSYVRFRSTSRPWPLRAFARDFFLRNVCRQAPGSARAWSVQRYGRCLNALIPVKLRASHAIQGTQPGGFAVPIAARTLKLLYENMNKILLTLSHLSPRMLVWPGR